MMKQLLQLSIFIGLMLAFTACSQDQLEGNNPMTEVPEGYVAVSFKVNVPDMTKVQARAVDPDGLDVHNMKLFCFNSYGLFITVAYATDFHPDNTNHTGTFDAVIPSETTAIHFVANQNIGQYNLSDFAGKSEAEVFSAMEGGSGMMIYWARFAQDPNKTDANGEVKDIKTQLQELPASNTITLIRNQAKVSIVDLNNADNDGLSEDDWDNAHFTVTGFRTVNIHAFGTVAPYCEEHGFEIQSWPNDHVSVTLPGNQAMLSDIVDVNTAKADYIFEHENTLDNPVSVIIRGRNKSGSETDELYYRVLLQDADGNLLPILRNHHYQINIKGSLSYGQSTFEDALTAPASNNVWIAVNDWVKTISDGTNTLGVDETHIVLGSEHAGSEYVLNFTASQKPEVSWAEGNHVASQNIPAENITYDAATQKGTIKLNLLPMAATANQQSGTLMLKLGMMFRKVDITVVKTMSFAPSWVSSNVNLNAGENITLKFTVPEDCPEGLFPFPVMISVNDLDVRAASGMKLPVRKPNEVEWYGNTVNDLGYKYEYMVEEPGVHRLYFSSILPHADGDKEDITLEAEFFATLTKSVNFTDNKYQITLPTTGTNPFHYFNGSDVSGYQNDEPIYYLLVPQKLGATVTFDLQLNEKNGTTLTSKTSNVNDEFFLYSKTLDLVDNGYTSNLIDASTSLTSGSNGRTIMFYPNAQTNSMTIKATTNMAKSADVVRISSNKQTSKSVKNQNVNYAGDEYRSAIFEFANYRPFRFAAQVQVKDGTPIGTWAVDEYGQPAEAEDPIDNVTMTYEPNQQVNISFDVTSFKGSDEKDVDPFGNSFEIYIDAPMLKLADDLGAYAGKIKEDPDKEGRFIYTVAATREAEKLGGNALLGGVANERKTIPFVKKSITTTGNIVISSEEDKVVYYQKTFKVSTERMTGNIQFVDKTDSQTKPVPKDAFVAFIRTETNARIGVMTIDADGHYSLNLRSEYVFNWDDKIELDFKKDGVTYDCNTISTGSGTVDLTLQSLFQYKNVVLTEATD